MSGAAEKLNELLMAFVELGVRSAEAAERAAAAAERQAAALEAIERRGVLLGACRDQLQGLGS